MDKVKEFLKSKTPAYYIAAADALLALVLAIVFFLTYKGAMANNAASSAPETIGIFLLAGFVVEVAALVLPQYKFIHIGAVVMYGLALFKEVILIPALIADWANNVKYQGGDLGTNVFYLVVLLLIMISAVVACFMGFYKDEAKEEADFKQVKGTTSVVKLSVCGVLTLAAIVSSTVISSELTRKAATGGEEKSSEKEKWNPITEDLKKLAAEYDYDFDPASVLIKEQTEWDFSDTTMRALPTSSAERDGEHLVYYFEGSYAEGYQGDYSETYAYLYLWEDGLFAGKSKDTEIRGYWYNSSLANGVDEEGNDIIDCLNMVSYVSRYESIITESSGGFYERQAYIYLNMGWGQRSIIIKGFKYYPTVGLFIDAHTDGETPKFKVGDNNPVTSWVANRVLKNLTYSAVFKSGEVKWTIPEGMLENKKLAAAGEYEIVAKWQTFEASINLIVEEAEAE